MSKSSISPTSFLYFSSPPPTTITTTETTTSLHSHSPPLPRTTANASPPASPPTAFHVVKREEIPSLCYCFQWLFSHGGKQVNIAGSFSDWRQIPMEPNHQLKCWQFNKILSVSPSPRYQYKFVVDGVWQYDCQKRTVTDSYGNINNEIDVVFLMGDRFAKCLHGRVYEYVSAPPSPTSPTSRPPSSLRYSSSTPILLTPEDCILESFPTLQQCNSGILLLTHSSDGLDFPAHGIWSFCTSPAKRSFVHSRSDQRQQQWRGTWTFNAEQGVLYFSTWKRREDSGEEPDRDNFNTQELVNGVIPLECLNAGARCDPTLQILSCMGGSREKLIQFPVNHLPSGEDSEAMHCSLPFLLRDTNGNTSLRCY